MKCNKEITLRVRLCVDRVEFKGEIVLKVETTGPTEACVRSHFITVPMVLIPKRLVK